jgi:hypothetical protein
MGGATLVFLRQYRSKSANSLQTCRTRVSDLSAQWLLFPVELILQFVDAFF